jgi:hypothetical protein
MPCGCDQAQLGTRDLPADLLPGQQNVLTVCRRSRMSGATLGPESGIATTRCQKEGDTKPSSPAVIGERRDFVVETPTAASNPSQAWSLS